MGNSSELCWNIQNIYEWTFEIKHRIENFNAVALDLKLEQTVGHKVWLVGGFLGQTREKKYDIGRF